MIVKTRNYRLERPTYIKLALGSVLRQQWWTIPIALGICLLYFWIPSFWWIFGGVMAYGLYVLFWLIQFYGVTQLEQGKMLLERFSYEINSQQIVMKINAREGMPLKFDEGKNWDTFSEGLETKNISSIEIDDEYIYVGTFGHIYKRPLSELNAINVFGEVFEDVNQNGIKEPNENPLKNILVRSTVNNIIKPTNELGQFSLITKDIADNKIEIIEPQYSTSTNGPILISNSSNPIQLGISFDKEINDVGIKILSPFVFRPGFTTQNDLYLENLSYNDRVISVGLILDDKLTLITSSYSPYNLNGPGRDGRCIMHLLHRLFAPPLHCSGDKDPYEIKDVWFPHSRTHIH